MLTRKHSHARDLLRRQRAAARESELTFVQSHEGMLGEFIFDRGFWGERHPTPCPATMNRDGWRNAVKRLCELRTRHPMRRLP